MEPWLSFNDIILQQTPAQAPDTGTDEQRDPNLDTDPVHRTTNPTAHPYWV